MGDRRGISFGWNVSGPSPPTPRPGPRLPGHRCLHAHRHPCRQRLRLHHAAPAGVPPGHRGLRAGQRSQPERPRGLRGAGQVVRPRPPPVHGVSLLAGGDRGGGRDRLVGGGGLAHLHQHAEPEEPSQPGGGADGALAPVPPLRRDVRLEAVQAVRSRTRPVPRRAPRRRREPTPPIPRRPLSGGVTRGRPTRLPRSGNRYIMSGGIAGAESFLSGISVTTASVVSTMAAIDAAFCSAERVTLAGSTMPALTMSTLSPFRASEPMPILPLRTFSTPTEPS